MTSINTSLSSSISNYLSSDASVASTEKTDAPKLTNTSLSRYLDSTPSEDIDAKKIFEKLSIDLGGDGKSITKDQLDSYVSSAKDGTIVISDEELNSLKELQDNWEEISEGADSVNFYDVNATGYKDTLLSMAPEDNAEKVDFKSIARDATAQALAYIADSALSFSPNGSSSKASPTSLLQTLLTGNTDEYDDSNADLIATLTNIIANSKKTSTIEAEA